MGSLRIVALVGLWMARLWQAILSMRPRTVAPTRSEAPESNHGPSVQDNGHTGVAHRESLRPLPHPVGPISADHTHDYGEQENGKDQHRPQRTDTSDADAGGDTGPRSTLTGLLESLLFVSEVAVGPEQLAKAVGTTVPEIEVGLAQLRRSYLDEGRGLRIQERNGKFLLVTMPAAAGAIETFLNLDLTSRLSGPALETLAIIAYRQPATRAQIEAVRGVDCGGVLRTLLQHGLAEEMGRLETPGRPILYGITDLFMQHFGLSSLQDLPPLQSEEADSLWAATELDEEPAPEAVPKPISLPAQ